jgi:hypothetical protein
MKPLFALKSWTIQRRGERFFIAPTAPERRHQWEGPYKNLRGATEAIARRLAREFSERNLRAFLR